MIEVRDLTKTYGDRNAIANLNFTIKKGEVVGFLGPNGAGKTTTMRIITGYMAPSTGQVKVGGFDVFENPIEVKRRIGYLPETPPVYGDMVVTDYLKYVCRLKGVEKDSIDKYVDEAIQRTQLGEVKGRLIQNLSKGFRQRVGLAQAIVSKPEILILDEPTVGLDPRQVAEFRSLLRELKGEHTIILSTHILPEVQATCERVIIINRGRIVAEDSLTGLSQRLSGGGSVQLRVRRPSTSLVTALRSLGGVADVKDQTGVVTVQGHLNDDLLEQIAETAVREKAGLVQMSPADLGLEDIFIKLTTAQA